MGSDIDQTKFAAAAPLDDAKADAPPQRSIFVELILTGGPIFAQMAGYTAMMFVDTFMLSYIGDNEATAAGAAGAVSFVPMCFGMGVLMLVNTLVSQAYGRREFRLCGQFLWQGLWFGIAYALALMPTLLFADPIFRAMGHPADLVPLEVDFYRIVIAGAIVKMIGTTTTQFLIGVNRTGLVAIAAICGVTLNLFGNYALVLGHWGFPRMGVTGSAISTVTSTVLELLITGFVIFGPKMRQLYHTLDWRFRSSEMSGLLRLGVPTGAAMVGEVGAWTAFNVWVMVQLGETTLKSNNYAFRYMLVSFMPAMGFGAAVTTLVGRYIGRKRLDLAAKVTHVGFVMAGTYMLLCGLIQYFFGRELMAVFTHEKHIQDIGVHILVFMGVYQILDATYVVYNGGLRGAGDTRVPAIVMIALNWVLVVAGSFAVARYAPSWGASGPYSVLCLYGVLLGVFMYLRFMFGPWRKIDLSKIDEGHSRPVLATGV
ncbi:MAG: MATE family efflux transporter [Tepidisphaeraceae bacterium]